MLCAYTNDHEEPLTSDNLNTIPHLPSFSPFQFIWYRGEVSGRPAPLTTCIIIKQLENSSYSYDKLLIDTLTIPL